VANITAATIATTDFHCNAAVRSVFMGQILDLL